MLIEEVVQENAKGGMKKWFNQMSPLSKATSESKPKGKPGRKPKAEVVDTSEDTKSKQRVKAMAKKASK
jgi:hypothetical protein|tara:strand:- start:110 stop:316 length:207 start_codon:yes stop_codon:yes gene_type:complete